jgi:hypothetical protein
MIGELLAAARDLHDAKKSRKTQLEAKSGDACYEAKE